MPFDGSPQITPQITESRSTRAVLMLDYLTEFLDGGRNWQQGYFNGPSGRRCLVQAMHDLTRRHRLAGHGAGRYILRAIREETPSQTLMRFNDTCASYDELERVLRRAREMVMAECGVSLRAGCYAQSARSQNRLRPFG